MSQNETKTANFESISFEDALRELETIVTSLERGDVSLDEADRKSVV